MADIAVLVAALTVNGSNLEVLSMCCCEGIEPFGVYGVVPLDSTPTTINAALMTAAIAGAAARNVIVGALDKKTIYGGAVAQIV